MHVYAHAYTYICIYTNIYTNTYISVGQNNKCSDTFSYMKGEKPSWECNKTQMTCTQWGKNSLQSH